MARVEHPVLDDMARRATFIKDRAAEAARQQGDLPREFLCFFKHAGQYVAVDEDARVAAAATGRALTARRALVLKERIWPIVMGDLVAKGYRVALIEPVDPQAAVGMATRGTEVL